MSRSKEESNNLYSKLYYSKWQTERENKVLELVEKFKIPCEQSRIISNSKFNVGCPSPFDPLNKKLNIELNWGLEDNIQPHKSILYQEFEKTLKIFEIFYNSAIYKVVKSEVAERNDINKYLHLDIYGRVMFTNILNYQSSEVKRNIAMKISPYIFDNIDSKMITYSEIDKKDLTSENIIYKLIYPYIVDCCYNYNAEDKQTINLNSISTESNHNSYSDTSSRVDSNLLHKLKDIAKFVKYYNDLNAISSNTHMAFIEVFSHIVFGMTIKPTMHNITLLNFIFNSNDMSAFFDIIINLDQIVTANRKSINFSLNNFVKEESDIYDPKNVINVIKEENNSCDSSLQCFEEIEMGGDSSDEGNS